MSHGGYIPPYESLMHLFPSLNLGIFVTMNGPGTAAASAEPVNALLNKIFDILQGTDLLKLGIQSDDEFVACSRILSKLMSINRKFN